MSAMNEHDVGRTVLRITHFEDMFTPGVHKCIPFGRVLISAERLLKLFVSPSVRTHERTKKWFVQISINAILGMFAKNLSVHSSFIIVGHFT